MQIIVVSVILLLIFFGAGYKKELNDKRAYKEKLLKKYGKENKRRFSAEELKSIRGYFEYHPKDDCIDDITWNDLDMNIIYTAMDYCQSSAGDEYLYYMLRSPKTHMYDWSGFEEKVKGLTDDPMLRSDIGACLHEMGRSGNYSLYSYLNRLDETKSIPLIKTAAGALCYIPAIGICFYNLAIGLSLIFLLAVYNIASYFKLKRTIEPYIVCFEYVFRVIKNCEMIMSVIKDKELLFEEKTDLVNIIKSFKSFKRFSSFVIGELGSGPLGVFLDYIKMLTHLDLIKFGSMLEQIKQNKDGIDQILTIIGKIDCYISVGEYRAFLEFFSIPDLDDSYEGISITDGYHPLLENAIPNSLNTQKCVLLTGSNASGKSTFLKTVAVNALLAQSVHTSCSKKYKAPYFYIYSSLGLKDSIISGESYYMAEIKALKRITDASAVKKNVLCFVDEVLRGTNTTERIAASSAILRNLSGKGVFVFAATHDLELTSVLNDIYENYHFDEEMLDNDIRFPYRLSPGRATSRNAIKLLDIFGYDRDIIDKANEMVREMESRL